MNTDNFSDELTPSDRTGVSFAAAVDNEEPPYRKKSSQELRAAKARQSLSASAKQWDLDGDGELDDAEMALRNLDRSHKGTLSKEQMYELMADNLQTQRQLFKVKKVVIGLVAFTCVLALCNLGTSFAAAFLAKDTTTANGKFVDTHTGNTLKTDSSATTFNIDKELTDANRRRLVLACDEARRLVNPNAGNNAPTNYDCTVADNAVFMADGAAIVDSCEAGGTVNVVHDFSGSPGPTHLICQLGADYSATYDDINDQGTKYPTMSVVYNGQSFITIGPNAERTSYVITGLYSQGTQRCDIAADCVPNSGLTCESNVCTAPPAAEEATTTTTTTTTTPVTAASTIVFDSNPYNTSCDAAQANQIGTWVACPDTGATGECTCVTTESVDVKTGEQIFSYNWESCLEPMCEELPELPEIPVGDAAQAPGGISCTIATDCDVTAGEACYEGIDGTMTCGFCGSKYNSGCDTEARPTCIDNSYCSCSVNADCASGSTCGTGTYCGTENWCSTNHDDDDNNPCGTTTSTTTTTKPPL
jgi:hypothetical protein